MTAIISDCGAYRYTLEREVAPSGPVFLFIGVNPSTADATTNDATVRKWIGFVKRWGGRGFLVGNAFAYRATDVRELATAKDPIGLMNDWHIMQMAIKADVIVPCWGNTSKVPRCMRGRFDSLAGMLTGADKPLHCFGMTQSGDPLHPLMLGYSTPLLEFSFTELLV